MTHSNAPHRVLTVCLGNICRSPSAEIILRKKCKQAGLAIAFDSAATGGHTKGSSPDERAIAVGSKLGYDLSGLVARQIQVNDFYDFDLVLVMDADNLQNLKTIYAIAKQQSQGQKLATLALYDPSQMVDDPYYGTIEDFKAMYQHLEKVADEYVNKWS